MMMGMVMMAVFMHVSSLFHYSSLSAGSLSKPISEVKVGFRGPKREIPV
jgi:hypothetical protein